MRSATMLLLALAIGGVALLAVLGLTRESSLVYTLGVQPQLPVALPAGMTACQAPIVVPRGERFERVVFYPANPADTPAKLEISVSDAAGERWMARAVTAPRVPPEGTAPPPAQRVDVGGLSPDGPVRVCFENRGKGQVDLWGSTDIASGPTTATIDATRPAADIALVLERDDARSILALLPEMADRASLFRARWLSPGAFAVIAVLVLVAVPALLVSALRTARD
jgi:hypothetical protein